MAEDAHILFLYKKDGQRTYHTVADQAALCDLVLQLCEEDLLRKRGMLKPSSTEAGDNDTGAEATTTAAPAVHHSRVLQYDAADLLNFLDAHLSEVVVLRFNVDDRRYDPEGRDWLKNRLYQSLLDTANAAEKKNLTRTVL
jgi:hypothetical protein